MSRINELFEAIAKCSEPTMMYMNDLATDISTWCDYAVDYFDLPGTKIKDFPSIWIPKIYPEDRHIFEEDIEQVFSGKSDAHACDYRVKNAQGEYVWVSCAGKIVRDEEGNAVTFVGTMRHYGINAKYDSVTNLMIAMQFHEDFSNLLARNRDQIGVMLLDVDAFKKVNDYYGFSFGNHVLGRVAAILSSDKSVAGWWYKMEGDRFAFLCPNAVKEDMQALFHRLNEYLMHALIVDGKNVILSLTGGAAIVSHREEKDAAFGNLEYVLEIAKKEKPGTLLFYSDEMKTEEERVTRMKEKLHESVQNHCKGFYLTYQPQILSDGTQLLGAEALLRFRDSDTGEVISPAEFIPALEESGDIIRVGEWVLTHALKQMIKWYGKSVTHCISVNVSYRQFLNPQFKKFVVEEVRRLSFPADRLILELTESCKILDLYELKDDIAFLKNHGIQISLDDFGTGYASINVLRQLPVNWVKIDHSFVADIRNRHMDQMIVKYIVAMCKEVNINVCVEGIENREILDIIKESDPTLYQGYFFGRPMEAEQYFEKYQSGIHEAVYPRTNRNFIRPEVRNGIVSIAEERFRTALSMVKQDVFEYDVRTNMIMQTQKNGADSDWEYEPFIRPEKLVEKGIVYRDDVDTFIDMYHQIRKGVPEVEWTGRNHDGKGGIVWLHIHYKTIFDELDRPVTAIGVFENISEQVSADRRLEEFEKQKRLLATDVIASATVNVTKYKMISVECFNIESLELLHTEDCSIVINYLISKAADQESKDVVCKYLNRDYILNSYAQGQRQIMFEYCLQPEGQNQGVWVAVLLMLEKESQTRDVMMYGFIRDIHEQKNREMSLESQATRDKLTGILNRSTFEMRVDHWLMDPENQRKYGAFLIMDLDNFKGANDTYGHAYGDKLLIRTAQILKQLFRSNDYVGRLGGDEFVIFMTDITDGQAARDKASRVCEKIYECAADKERAQVSCSIGVAISSTKENCFDLLYLKADRALYHSKKLGKNQAVLLDED